MSSRRTRSQSTNSTSGSSQAHQTNDTIPIKKIPEKIPEKILGATFDSSGQLQFFMKWRGIEKCEFIPAKEANLKWPRCVLGFYEASFVWDRNS